MKDVRDTDKFAGQWEIVQQNCPFVQQFSIAGQICNRDFFIHIIKNML